MASSGRRPRRPQVVRVEGDPIPIRWMRALRQMPEGYRTGAQYFPRTRGGRPRIDVYTQSRTVARNALVHEVGHDLWRRAGLHLRFGSRTEELLMDELVVGIVEVLRENPAVARFVLERKR